MHGGESISLFSNGTDVNGTEKPTAVIKKNKE